MIPVKLKLANGQIVKAYMRKRNLKRIDNSGVKVNPGLWEKIKRVLKWRR